MIIAIAACALYPDLSASNQSLHTALETQGAEVRVLLWNRDPFDAFLACDLILLRQTWDYILDPGGYAAWLTRLEALGGRVENPARLAIWNNDKRSLMDIAAPGISIPETTGVLDGAEPTLRDPLPTRKIVLKPAFGGGGHGVRLCTLETLAESLAELQIEAPGQPVLAQEFLPEIAQGELKMAVIEGQVALTVLARPQPGEFRINSRFDPIIENVHAPADARRVATKLAQFLGTPLYARVDGIMRDGRFICTELELTDPDLFLDRDPAVAARFAAATLARAGRDPVAPARLTPPKASGT